LYFIPQGKQYNRRGALVKRRRVPCGAHVDPPEDKTHRAADHVRDRADDRQAGGPVQGVGGSESVGYVDTQDIDAQDATALSERGEADQAVFQFRR
jgi:hypothetical protein